MCEYGYGWGHGWGGGGVVLMTVLLVFLVISVIVAITFAVRHLSGSGGVGHRGGLGSDGIRAEDRLADRFARSEIDEDEFRRRMALLREHR